ncbi:MAG TPA: hypothetical protein VNN08_00240 [Thermoanaerobaculia bacterium]|nr:hypothetical protein [Thermoanaerobaculia bacterium]
MRKHCSWVFLLLCLAIALPVSAADNGCDRTVWADVVALDQPFLVNRLGAAMPEGMVYALRRDVVSKTCAGGVPCGDPLVKGNVMLRAGKRPRPIVLRANVGDCLNIKFTNLLSDNPVSTQPATRYASVHVAGMQVVGTIDSDGSFVASNNNSTVGPGGTITYVLRATAEGTFLLNSEGAAFGGNNQPNDGAQVTAGLFGAVNVQPRGAEWYRSQVSHADLELAIDTSKSGGFSPLGQPFLNYKAVYPAGNPNQGVPILAMLDSKNNLIYTDLTAVITGPNAGKFVNTPPCDPNLGCINIEPNRLDPYREFTIEYHELMDAVQAFPIFGESKPLDMATTLGAAGDAFAINYGSGGIGAEILANRFGIGPMGSCADCRFEEFFLSAWTAGDPAMLVDVPANLPCANQPNQPAVTKKAGPGDPTNIQCTLGVTGNAPAGITPYRKATRALYDDDPTNVYHSYINDRVKFRVLHAGTGVSHVHHLHAHQWVHSPNSDGSTYLDSQLINPGSAYTMEITFNGGGNRNKVVGDSIFHCHFYPHFAAGMWALWRSHDVFEVGSPFQSTKFPQQMSKFKGRALPDGEIAAGTPIPALIPMPTLMMAPMPSEVNVVPVKDPNGGTPPVGYEAVVAAGETNVNPGFPFFIPGIGGTRAPHPPLDFAVDKGVQQDGGLPRHLLVNATITAEQHNTIDFTKDYAHVNAFELPETGTPVEKTAMAFHSQCFHPSFTPEGVGSGANNGFRTNGLPPASGAPYADPGLVPYDENSPPANPCLPIQNWIKYKAAVIQLDLVLNKSAWHYPQSRILTLWNDVLPTYRSEVPQEPFFIRANERQGVEYWHTNLVPNYYKVDDYQVNTPTDIIGQHIHLVKFDVTASDGAVNGYNYEDGTLSYQEVQELVDHVNQCGGLTNFTTDLNTLPKCGTNTGPGRTMLTLKPPPDGICPASEMNKLPCSGWSGAQTTIQRWFADPIPQTPCTAQQAGNCTLAQTDKNDNGTRTLRTVFTHDHFGPSTHQQTGLYAALLVEPENSKWFQSETGTQLGSRDDGGPTTWNAVIQTPNSEANTYREFALAMQDFQFAYTYQSKTSPDPITSSTPGWSDPANVIEAPFGNKNKLQPQIISAGPTSGVTSFNYRNDPLGLRVAAGSGGDPNATDLSYVFASNVKRNQPTTADPVNPNDLNKQPVPGTPINPAAPNAAFIFPKKPITSGMQGGDPYTPLLRAYEGDRVQVRVIAGAHMLPHAFTVGGMKWLFEPSFDDSGHRSTQSIGISEHFEFLFHTPRASPSKTANVNWADYLYMPDASNQKHSLIDGTWGIFRAYQSSTPNLMPLPTNGVPTPLPDPPASNVAGYSCPPGAPMTAMTVVSRTPSTITFNSRGSGPQGRFPSTQITNFYPLMLTLDSNQNTSEPLILRAKAGDCIALTLENAFNSSSQTFNQTSTPAYDSNITLSPSKYVGLTPGLLSFDAMKSTGLNVGFNPVQTVPISSKRTYYWYAGQTTVAQDGTVTGVPMELGSVNLTPSDPLEQDLHGLVGGLVVEPAGSIACVDTYNGQSGLKQYGSATVYASGTCANPGKLLYREFVLLTQDDLANVEWNGATWSLAGTTFTAPGGSSQVAINYRTEPMPYRFADSTSNFNKRPDLWQGFSNGLVLAEPQTPIFTAAKGTPTRFRLLHPGGSGNQQVLALHGHVWQEEPYTGVSTAIGNNQLSQYLGARDNYGTNMAYEIDLPSAGGAVPVAGDYVYRTTPSNYLEQGLWGVFRVTNPGSDAVRIGAAQFVSGTLTVSGSTTVFVDTLPNAKSGSRAKTVSLYLGNKGQQGTLLSSSVPVTDNGIWYFTTKSTAVGNQPMQITAISPNGGKAVFPLELVLVPATPTTVTPSAYPVSESDRYIGLPRSHGEKNPQPTDDQIPASLNAPAAVDSTAPATQITPPKPPKE